MRLFGALVCLVPSLARADVPQADVRQFLNKAYSLSRAGVELGKLAQHRGQSPQVRDYGAVLERNHQRALATLEPAAHRAGLAMPTSIQREESDLYTKLLRRRGREFDEMFSDEMMRADEQTISLFEDEAKHGQSRELSKWAEDQLPVLKQQEAIAKRDLPRM
jgi:putative membrane protein